MDAKLKEVHYHINNIHPLTKEEFKAFISIFEPATLNKKEYFSLAGEKELKMGILVEGVVRAYVMSSNGTEVNKQLFTKFQTVGGYSSLITKQPNKLSYQALTDCTLFTASYNDMLKLYDEYRNIERLGRVSLENLFVAKEKRELELLTLNATERYLILKKETPTIEQEISLTHIASYLGVTPTQLSRIRKSLL